VRILVIGGTVFVGRHMVERALARGHEVTLFHRGLSGPDLFRGVERIRGDRETELDRLAGRRWDAVVDTCAYRPGTLRKSVAALASSVGLYLFVSTISVYRDFAVAGITEEYPTGTLPDLAPGQDPDPALPVTGATYGPLKALAERELRTHLPDRHLIVRPGLIVGPGDTTNRFAYWVARTGRGGRMAVPGRPDSPSQFIDARDLAAFMVHLLERGVTGTVHATGPDAPLDHAGLVKAWAARLPDPAEPVWIPMDMVNRAGLTLPPALYTWADLPPAMAHIQAIDIGRARSLGLTLRPPVQTVTDVRLDLAGRGHDGGVAGLAPLEQQLLMALDRLGG